MTLDGRVEAESKQLLYWKTLAEKLTIDLSVAKEDLSATKRQAALTQANCERIVADTLRMSRKCTTSGSFASGALAKMELDAAATIADRCSATLKSSLGTTGPAVTAREITSKEVGKLTDRIEKQKKLIRRLSMELSAARGYPLLSTPIDDDDLRNDDKRDVDGAAETNTRSNSRPHMHSAAPPVTIADIMREYAETANDLSDDNDSECLLVTEEDQRRHRERVDERKRQIGAYRQATATKKEIARPQSARFVEIRRQQSFH